MRARASAWWASRLRRGAPPAAVARRGPSTRAAAVPRRVGVSDHQTRGAPAGSPRPSRVRSKRREKTTSKGRTGAAWVSNSRSGPPPKPTRVRAPDRSSSHAARADRTGVTATSKRPGPSARSASPTDVLADMSPVERTASTEGAWRSTSAPWSWVSATSSAPGKPVRRSASSGRANTTSPIPPLRKTRTRIRSDVGSGLQFGPPRRLL
jgi:hypothetical protein